MSKRIIKITESQFQNIVKNITEDFNSPNDIDEGIWDTIKQPFSKIRYGIKGIRGGFGYDYMAFAVEIRNILKDLKSADRPNEKLIMKLSNLKTRVSSTNMRPDLKSNLENAIDKIVQYYKAYSNLIDRVSVVVNQRLKS